MYISLIKAKLDNCCRFLYPVALQGLETKIEDLKTKDDNKNAGQ